MKFNLFLSGNFFLSSISLKKVVWGSSCMKNVFPAFLLWLKFICGIYFVGYELLCLISAINGQPLKILAFSWWMRSLLWGFHFCCCIMPNQPPVGLLFGNPKSSLLVAFIIAGNF